MALYVKILGVVETHLEFSSLLGHCSMYWKVLGWLNTIFPQRKLDDRYSAKRTCRSSTSLRLPNLSAGCDPLYFIMPYNLMHRRINIFLYGGRSYSDALKTRSNQNAEIARNDQHLPIRLVRIYNM